MTAPTENTCWFTMLCPKCGTDGGIQQAKVTINQQDLCEPTVYIYLGCHTCGEEWDTERVELPLFRLYKCTCTPTHTCEGHRA